MRAGSTALLNCPSAASSGLCRPPRAAKRAGRAHYQTVRATRETERLLSQRLEDKGWAVPSTDFHPLVREAWAAANSIYAAPVFETPLNPAPWLAASAESCCVHLKMETRQATGSFKARGAAHKLLSLSPEQLAKGVVASSTGNHALAVLHAFAAAARAAGAAGSALSAPVIYLPNTASHAKLDKLRALGADLVLHGTDCVEAEAEARRAAEQGGKVYVSPYNDVQVAGGQGTIALELLMQAERGHLDTVFIPVGGGGLAAGVAAVLKAADPNIHIVGCQPEVSDVMRQSVEAGHVVQLPWRETISEGTAGGLEKDTVTLEPCTRFVDEWMTVSEKEIAKAMIETTSHTGVAVEAATGVAVAAFHKQAPQLRHKHIVIIVCGGNVGNEQLDRAYEIAGLTSSGART